MKTKLKKHDKRVGRKDHKLVEKQKELSQFRRNRPRELIEDVTFVNSNGLIPLLSYVA
jgi:hypothetical protein